MNPIEEPHDQDHPVTLVAHIAARFEQIALPKWTAVVFAWFVRLDGIGHGYFEDREGFPALQVLRCITELEQGTPDDEAAHAGCHFDFLTWQVRHPETGERRDPLSLSPGEFIGEGLSPNRWKRESAFPPSRAIASWLIEQRPHH